MSLTHDEMVERTLDNPQLRMLRRVGVVEAIRIVTRDDRPNRADVYVKTNKPVEEVDLRFTLRTGGR